MDKRAIPLLAVLCLLPLAATVVAVACAPESVPLHVSGTTIDRWGPKTEFFAIGGIVTATCLLFSLMFAKMETLNRMGLVHGTGTRGGRITTVCCMALVDAVLIGYLIWAILTALPA